MPSLRKPAMTGLEDLEPVAFRPVSQCLVYVEQQFTHVLACPSPQLPLLTQSLSHRQAEHPTENCKRAPIIVTMHYKLPATHQDHLKLGLFGMWVQFEPAFHMLFSSCRFHSSGWGCSQVKLMSDCFFFSVCLVCPLSATTNDGF